MFAVFTLTVESLGTGLFAAALFGAVGIALLILGYKVFEWITPTLDVEKKLQEGSVAVAITVAGLLIAIAIILAAAIQG